MHTTSCPTRQLDGGTYQVFHGEGQAPEDVIGLVYVEDLGDNVLIEHWVLHTRYDGPTSFAPLAVYPAPGHIEFSDPLSFFDAMRAAEPSDGAWRYIKATCESSATLPD